MIVIPMAGLSSRFARAGYGEPKYRLPLHGRPVFDHAVATFRTVFDSADFLFVARDEPGLSDFLDERLASLGVARHRLVRLEAPTRGQAETVLAGLDRAGVPAASPLTIFNVDTFGLGAYAPPERRFPDAAGVLQVFRGQGDNWSFVEPDPDTPGRALRTAEKVPISDLCCTGLYHFARAHDFRAACAAELRAPQAAELYVAPLYNHLIRAGGVVRYDEIPAAEVAFCGVPAEYEALLRTGRADAR